MVMQENAFYGHDGNVAFLDLCVRRQVWDGHVDREKRFVVGACISCGKTVRGMRYWLLVMERYVCELLQRQGKCVSVW